VARLAPAGGADGLAGEPSDDEARSPAFGVGSSGEVGDISPPWNAGPVSLEDSGAVGVPLDLGGASVAEGFGGEVETADPGEEADEASSITRNGRLGVKSSRRCGVSFSALGVGSNSGSSASVSDSPS
jgi:hypothetical protein